MLGALMSTDSERVPAAKRSAAGPPTTGSKKKKKKVVARKPIVRPLAESEIHAPDRQTLIMLGVLAALSVTMWVFAHAGCNYHPPRETRRPRDVTTAELVREPKDAAIEFQQRLLTLNYAGALEIAGGPLVATLKERQSECLASDPGCQARRKKLADVITTAVMLERTPFSARLRVTSHNLAGGPKTFLALVERDATGWKVTAQVPDAPGAQLPPPSLSPAMELPTMGSALQAPGAASSSAGPRIVLTPHGTPSPHTSPVTLTPAPQAAPASPAPSAH
jgi:hypothetical protein